MPKKKYNMSAKRKERDMKLTDWEKHVTVLIKMNQLPEDMSLFRKTVAVGAKIGISRQRVEAIYNKVKELTVIELEAMQRKYESVRLN